MDTNQRASSYRFFVQMIINVFLCKKAQEIIAKRVMKQPKISKQTYTIYLVFAITLFCVNQGVFMFFKDPNLYEKIGASRRLNIAQLKQWGQERYDGLYKIYKDNPTAQMKDQTMTQMKELQETLQVLTHPARRLTYDSFGFSGTQYAWAFKVPGFILSTIIGSGFFFVICTVISLMNKKKSDLKQAFKAQIFAMILLFIWEVDLIISTESRLNIHSVDLIDYIYKNFPIFERREMLKTIIIPCMSLVEIFVRFFITSPAEKKMLEYGEIPALQKLTLPLRQKLGGIKNDEHLEDKVKLVCDKFRQKEPIKTEIFELQRQNLKTLLNTHREEMVAKQKLGNVINYFIIQ